MTTNSVRIRSYPVPISPMENKRGLIHQIRVHIYGECPECHSTHSKQVYGWAKRQCNECGLTWNY